MGPCSISTFSTIHFMFQLQSLSLFRSYLPADFCKLKPFVTPNQQVLANSCQDLVSPDNSAVLLGHTWYLSQTLSVEQKISWQAILHHITILFVLSCGALANCSIIICVVFELLVIGPYDKFTMYSGLVWFTQFWCKINFVGIYALLCGTKINQTILSVEAKLQISCMHSTL